MPSPSIRSLCATTHVIPVIAAGDEFGISVTEKQPTAGPGLRGRLIGSAGTEVGEAAVVAVEVAAECAVGLLLAPVIAVLALAVLIVAGRGPVLEATVLPFSIRGDRRRCRRCLHNDESCPPR